MLKSNPAFVEALVATVVEQLQLRNDVRLPGLGTLRVQHRPGRVERDEGGKRTLSAPSDIVVFDPA